MASFVKRRGPGGKTVWQARVERKGWSRQYATFDTKADAEKWASVIESEMARNLFVSRDEAEATTLQEALERYEKEITPHKRGAQRERRRIEVWCQHPLSRRSLASIQGKDVSEYIRKRSVAGAGANTIRLELALISHLYTVARTAWGMPYLANPVSLAKTARPRLPAGRNRRLREGEEERLLEAASAAFRPVIRWALATAMRRSEIAALRWEHVNIQQRSAHLPETKNGTARTVPLSREAVSILEALPRRIDGSVFGMSANAIECAWKRTRAAAEIEGLTFHDLRHEAISRLFERTDLDAMEIARVSGHKTLAMLSRYTHLRAHHLADRLDGAPRGRR